VATQRRPDSTAVVFEVSDKDTRAIINVDPDRDGDCRFRDNREQVAVQAGLAIGVLGEMGSIMSEENVVAAVVAVGRTTTRVAAKRDSAPLNRAG
jgi:hypothetical protein